MSRQQTSGILAVRSTGMKKTKIKAAPLARCGKLVWDDLRDLHTLKHAGKSEVEMVNLTGSQSNDHVCNMMLQFLSVGEDCSGSNRLIDLWPVRHHCSVPACWKEMHGLFICVLFRQKPSKGQLFTKRFEHVTISLCFLAVGIFACLAKNQEGSVFHCCSRSCQVKSSQFNSIYLYSAISQQMLSHDTLQIEQV